MFYETLRNKEIFAYLRDKEIECYTFNIVQQPKTIAQRKAFCLIEAKTNKCLMQHCVVV